MLENLREKDENYSVQIAEDIGSTKESVTGFLKLLRDTNLIKRGRRTKAQYYEITEKGNTFLSIIEEHKTLDDKLEEFL